MLVDAVDQRAVEIDEECRRPMDALALMIAHRTLFSGSFDSFVSPIYDSVPLHASRLRTIVP